MDFRRASDCWFGRSRGLDFAPWRLALLAVLAAAGSRGLSRERLLGILRPEGDEERGRHELAQTVYSLRRELGNDGVIAGTTELRLEPGAISSDVGDFAAALAAAAHGAVGRLYAGPFLDGFYLSDAPEFERWLDTERTRLAASAVRVLEQLAQSHETAGRHGEALTWWRRPPEIGRTSPGSDTAAVDSTAVLASAFGPASPADVSGPADRRPRRCRGGVCRVDPDQHAVGQHDSTPRGGHPERRGNPGFGGKRAGTHRYARQTGAQEILEGALAFASDGGLRLDLRRIDLESGVVREG